MGSSPLHASTVGLVRNLRTNHISPQFHVVYDDLFETVHASATEAPASWPDLFTFNCFKSDYNDEDFVPSLPDEWLTPVELAHQQQRDQAQRSHDGALPSDGPPIPDNNAARLQRAPYELPGSPQRAPPNEDSHSDSAAASPQRAPQRAPPPFDAELLPPEPDLGPELPTPIRRNPRRNPQRSCNKKAPARYRQHGFTVVRSYCRAMVGALLLTQGQRYDNRYLLNLLLDHDFGLYDNLSPNSLMMAPHAMKASATHDPDTPRLHEAMRGEHRDEFLAAMGKEIAELESHGTWTVIRKESMPSGANLLPSTWALKIKRYPDGRKRKSKARFCV